MNPYGGYLEFELSKGREHYRDCLRLNSGRNALEFVLRYRKYDKVYVPFYTCDVLLTPFKRTGVAYEHYSIDSNMRPIFNFSSLKSNEAIVVNNYFGLLDKYIEAIPINEANFIVDNAQAFYAKPLGGVDTFYSPRKFFGIPDGAYLAPKEEDSAQRLYQELVQDQSWDRCSHLLKRLDAQVAKGYDDFKQLSSVFQALPLRRMSDLTFRILDSLDYNTIATKRRDNYLRVHADLAKYNQLSLPMDKGCVPLAYPFLSPTAGLRSKLISKGVYVSQYWVNVAEWTILGSLEYELAENLVAIPIDQRYEEREIASMLKILIEML